MTDRYAPLPRPDWGFDLAAPLTVAACRRAFAETRPFTVGLEEELMLVSTETLDLLPDADRVLASAHADPRFRRELRAAQIELVTPVCDAVPEVERVTVAARADLVTAAGDTCAPLSAGTHPFSSEWGGVSDGDRYRLITELHPWASSRGMACGLHVHVAVGDPDCALAVYNALRSYVPEIAALGANSPFLDGRDTGHCSIRASLNETFPRAGIPPSFESWDDFVELLDWGRRSGTFPDATFLWWELRPHPGYGTIEFRMPDAQTAAADAVAVAAVCQALTAWLAARYEAGERLPVHDGVRIAQNHWSALRFGVTGWLVDLDTAEPEPTRERLGALLDELDAVAERLESAEQLARARTLIVDNGAGRQRYVAARDGLDGLVRWLVRTTALDE